MYILLVRHGETQATSEGRYEGDGDSPLTIEGQRRVKYLSNILASIGIDAVYSSPKKRCLETAWAIAEPHSLTVQVVPGLQEVNFGLWEGLTFEEVRRKDPDLSARWLDDPAHVRPPSGETLEEMASRVFQAFDDICRPFMEDQAESVRGFGGAIRLRTGKNRAEGVSAVAFERKDVGDVERMIHMAGENVIVIVSHGGPIRALLSRIDRGDVSGFWEYSVLPGAIYCISVKAI